MLSFLVIIALWLQALGNIVGYGLGAAPITLLPFVYYRVQGLYSTYFSNSCIEMTLILALVAIAVVLLLTVCVLLVANIQEKPFKIPNGGSCLPAVLKNR